MHELSIATALMEQIADETQRNNMHRVDRVEVHAGMLRQIIPDVMQEAFREARVDTVASKAVLVMKEISAQVRCCMCAKIFEPQLDCFVCPVCKEADVEILKGDEILLMAIEGE